MYIRARYLSLSKNQMNPSRFLLSSFLRSTLILSCNLRRDLPRIPPSLSCFHQHPVYNYDINWWLTDHTRFESHASSVTCFVVSCADCRLAKGQSPPPTLHFVNFVRKFAIHLEGDSKQNDRQFLMMRLARRRFLLRSSASILTYHCASRGFCQCLNITLK